MGMEHKFPSLEAQAAGGYLRGGDNTPQTATVVRGVYWEEGEIHDHGSQKTVPQGHYQLLDANDRVISHGDNYITGEHAKAALEGFVDDYGIKVEEVDGPFEVDAEDTALGKSSATGNMHCPACGGKVLKFSGNCDMCGEELVR